VASQGEGGEELAADLDRDVRAREYQSAFPERLGQRDRHQHAAEHDREDHKLQRRS
jgi:hypothetical protein